MASKKKQSIKGKLVMLWANGMTVALSNTLSIDITAETSDISNKDEGIWGATEIGKMTWSAENGAMYCASAAGDIQNTYDSLFEKMVAAEPITVTIGTPPNWMPEGLDGEPAPDGVWDEPAKGYAGKAVITGLKLQADDGSNGSVTVSFTGVGPLKKLS